MRGVAGWAGSALVSVAIAAAVVGWSAVGRLPRISDLWPADLSRPGGWLLDRQLSDLRSDAALCRRVLTLPHIAASPVPDAVPKPGCGWINAVEARQIADATLTASPMTCELAAAMALWMTHVVQPLAAQHLGSRVVGVDHLGTFACRNIRGSPAFANHPSEHATANALDLTGFRLADGRRLRIVSEWEGASPEAAFLKAVHAGACRYFRVAIGPGYNQAHRDHFHLDRGRWRACR